MLFVGTSDVNGRAGPQIGADRQRQAASYPMAGILKAGRVMFNIKGNDYRLVDRVQYQASVLVIRFFGTHAEYDEIDAETV
jgi:mRNA interferase HigB